MNDEDLKFPDWQSPLQELILEFDEQKLPEKIQKVEALILERLQQLEHGSDHSEEKLALQDALSILRMMRRDRAERLGAN